MQLRLPPGAPAIALPAPLAALALPSRLPATVALSSSSSAWQPSYSAMPDASRLRQPMSGGRLAAAQRQASVRGTSTSVRAQVMAHSLHAWLA
jgi:hypothetical protein